MSTLLYPILKILNGGDRRKYENKISWMKKISIITLFKEWWKVDLKKPVSIGQYYKTFYGEICFQP